jgi:hypothetical protein
MHTLSSTHPDWCSPVACGDDESITEHRTFPHLVGSALDDVRAVISTLRADEVVRGDVRFGTTAVELRLLSADAEDPADAERGDVLLDARAAMSLARALVDAATQVLIERGGAR